VTGVQTCALPILSDATKNEIDNLDVRTLRKHIYINVKRFYLSPIKIGVVPVVEKIFYPAETIKCL
jgi:hypothetical protein